MADGRSEGTPQAGEAHTDTKAQAIDRARKIIKNQGGGELRIKNEQGSLIDSDTIKPDRESSRRDTK